KRYGSMLGGVPRTFVMLPEGTDSPSTFEIDAFVAGVNEGRTFGTNGPFVRVQAENATGDSASLGDTLATAGEPVSFQIVVEFPEWMQVDRLDVYMNVDDVIMPAGEYDTSPIPPTHSYPIELVDEDLEVVHDGQSVHRRYLKVLDIELESDVDAYVVFMVHGMETAPIYPAILGRSVRAFAFTNPIYLDADGGGYDNPHLNELAQSAPPMAYRRADRVELDADELDSGRLTPADLTRIFHELTCSH
ncbi:MAG: hypothetical protein ACNA8W_16140, partial [Bradymonadaceae bacterium]